MELKRKLKVVKVFDNATSIIQPHNQLKYHNLVHASERLMKAGKRAGILHKNARPKYPKGIIGVEYTSIVPESTTLNRDYPLGYTMLVFDHVSASSEDI